MQYFGGKFRVRHNVAEIVNAFNPQVYLEPFCGSCWVAELVTAPIRICCDLNSDLICMYESLQRGWIPPDDITQEEYYRIKALPSPDPLRAFAGFGCSFAGKFFGGFARGGHGADAKTAKSQLGRRMYAKTAKSQLGRRMYAKTAKSQLGRRMYAKTAKSQGLKDIIFSCMDYEQAIQTYNPDVVYCDPPYAGTTKFYGLPEFDADRFWDVMRRESTLRTILISEYSAPSDFGGLAAFSTRTDIRSGKGQLIPRVERLFYK